MSDNCRQSKITEYNSFTATDPEARKDNAGKRKIEEMSDPYDSQSRKAFRGHTCQTMAFKSNEVSQKSSTKNPKPDDKTEENDSSESTSDDDGTNKSVSRKKGDTGTSRRHDDVEKTKKFVTRKNAETGASRTRDKSDDDDNSDEDEKATDKAANASENSEEDEEPKVESDNDVSSGSHEGRDNSPGSHENWHNSPGFHEGQGVSPGPRGYVPQACNDFDEDFPSMLPSYETDDNIYEEGYGPQKSAGTPMEKLPKLSSSNPRKLPDLKRLRGTESHSVLFNNIDQGFFWDERHVKMPNDHNNQMVVFTGKGKETGKRWNAIKEAYQHYKIKDVFQLENAILKYNGHRRQVWDFQCLKDYFLQSDYKTKKRDFFEKVFPKIKEWAFQLPELFKKSIPLLKKNQNGMITMTQPQAACLLANAFLCTFPWRNKEKRQNAHLPTINFNSLFNSPTTPNRLEKIQCIIHYFERMTKKMPDGNITFRRQVIEHSKFPDWENSSTDFTNLHVSSEGIIEDDGEGMLQVDFANKYVGGGVIGHGCVQEEIRFMICPEMIVSRLITEVLEENEVLIMTGCERFSNYTGYSDSFKWHSDHQDKVERDSWNRKYTEVVAMDAAVIGRDKNRQYAADMVNRELNKAYCAFKCEERYEKKIPAVCTGNWGCGAFGGNKELKGLLQLIAASEAGRDVLFLTFHDEEFVSALNFVHSKLKENYLSTGDMVKRIRKFNRKREYLDRSLFSALKDILV